MRLALAWPDGCQLYLAVGTHHPLREHAADRRVFERPNQRAVSLDIARAGNFFVPNWRIVAYSWHEYGKLP